MDKIFAIISPLFILLGCPFIFHHFGFFIVKDWILFIGVVISANAILLFKIMLSDYVKQFEIDNHCIQLSEMALTAFLATMAIQQFNQINILPISKLPYSMNIILSIGIGITLFTTAITAVIVKKIKNGDWKYSKFALPISYLVGLSGYSLYVALFLLKALS